MAGGFAHVTLVDRAHLRLDEVHGLTEDDVFNIGSLGTACQLGAVGPDYPYLALAGLAFGQDRWADLMHYERTAEPLRAGIRALRAVPAAPERHRALAWLFGFAAHIATDLTIHPVVMMKVGPYKGNEAAHRTCEMNQDVHIWTSRNLGKVGQAEYFDVLYESNTEGGRLSPAVAGLWDAMLRHTHPQAYDEKAPAFDAWHAGFHRAVDVAEDLPIFARHLLAGKGQAYPTKVDAQFIDGLATPHGLMHYDKVCALAEDNILKLWSILARALHAPEGEVEAVLAELPDGDLDTGRLLADPNVYALWSNP